MVAAVTRVGSWTASNLPASNATEAFVTPGPNARTAFSTVATQLLHVMPSTEKDVRRSAAGAVDAVEEASMLGEPAFSNK